jgi:TrmH family RNA methyltransferase
VRDTVEIHERDLMHAPLEHGNTRLHVGLPFFGCLILSVFTQITELARALDLFRQLRFQFSLECRDFVFKPLEQSLFHRSKRRIVPYPTVAITSRQHAIVKTFRRVARGDGPFALLDGWHLLSDALEADIRVDTVAVVHRARAETDGILDRARAHGATIVEVSTSVMDALSPVRTPTGVAAIVERPPMSIPDVFQLSPALIVLAIDMQDPGNVGAVIRAAEAGGATGVAFAGTSADPWGWKALRAAMGSTFRMPVVKTPNAADFFDACADASIKMFATVPRGGKSMHDVDLRGAVALVVGGEGPGLPQDAIDRADDSVSIPMHGRAESLNVAVAAALLVYEARRQRDMQEGTR